MSGTIVEVNSAVANNPSLVNTDPYGAGWFYKIKLSAASEAAALLDPAAYGAQIQG